MTDSGISKRNRSGAPPPPMGKYVPFARLGNGGMADVFLALARGPAGFDKLTVIKRLRNPGDDSLVGMFLDEARLSARLSHPNIVNTYEVGEVEGRFFIAMEYLDGQPLQALLSLLAGRGKGLGDALSAYVAMQALKGLHYAHELVDYDGSRLGVVHRDVSPHNLFVTYGGQVKLLDFGIAKATVNSTHTATGVLKGKIRYMAPEQVEEGDVDRRADVYALGIVLWEALARRPLHSGDSFSTLTRIVSQDPPRLRSIRAEVAPELDAIVARALRRDPNERYPTAEAMRGELEHYLRGTAETASDTELGSLMGEAFADTRDAVLARIKAHIAMLPERSADASSSITLLRHSIPPLFGEGSGPGSRRPQSAAPLVVPTPSVPARPRWPLVAGVLAVVLVAALGTVMRLVPGAQAPAATSLPPPAPERLRLETTPPGALVERNGKPIDRTPAEIDLPPGHQTLTVSLEGYDREEFTIDAEAGTAIERAVVLHAKAPVAPAAPAVATAAAAPAPAKPPSHGHPSRPPVAPAPASASAPPRAKIRVLDDDKIQVIEDQ
jgi:serine/threonine protein kinase